MKPKYTYLLLLLGIVLLGTFLRFYRITTVPPSLSHDETAIAYNAYSLAVTGKDEYGQPYPLLFKSFDDYKLPGMVYATIPSVLLFGRTALGARVPSALLGSLTILIVYLLVYELTKQYRDHSGKSTSILPAQVYALSAAFFFAISPWHINFSRQLFESNGALFFLSFGTYMLLLSLRKHRALILAALLLSVSVYFYYSVRLVIPFVLLSYVLVQRNKLASYKGIIFTSLFLFVITLLPIGNQMITPGGLERISIVSIVNDPNYLAWKDTFIKKYAESPTIVTKILYNQKTALIAAAADNYWKNIAPLHVFESGTSAYGLQHPFEIVTIAIGVLYIINFSHPSKWLLISWFLAAFLPGALSTNQPNALRTLLASPFLAICSGLGAAELMLAIERKRRLFYGVIPFALLLVYFFYAFYHSYLIVNPTQNALAFGDGYEQMIRYVKANESSYDRIVISGYHWRPYIFMLYWGNTDPRLYQREGTTRGWGKYVFTGAEWDKNEIFLYDTTVDPKKLIATSREKTLFILARIEFEKNRDKYQYIDTLSGRNAPAVFVTALSK
ncbi:hypothetical protein KJZ67_03995 [Patescibacteria group bacterium]|nr:hypothetical protein [Patescibacteria group bacterium]